MVGAASRRQRGDRHRRPAVDVLDVDIKPDGSGFAAFNRVKRAGLLTGASGLVRTRSGGLHVYFAGTAQRSAGGCRGTSWTSRPQAATCSPRRRSLTLTTPARPVPMS